MQRRILSILIGAAVSAMPLSAIGQSAPALTKAQAAGVVPSLSGKPCTEVIDDIRQQGSWAAFFHTCAGAEGGGEAIAHYASGRWTVVCGHGDDVLTAERAIAKCPGLSLADAVGIGMPPEDPEHYDVGNPVQAVEKFYALWGKRAYREMYAMLSPSYRDAHPYATWVANHSTATSISVQAATGSAPNLVKVKIYSSKRKDMMPDASYAGTWTLTKSGGAWLLDSVSLSSPAPPH